MPASDVARQANLNKASNLASGRLKAAHLDEWNGYMVEETKKLKEPWKPKPTDEERAAANLDALIKAYPALADRLVQPTLPVDEAAEPEEGSA